MYLIDKASYVAARQAARSRTQATSSDYAVAIRGRNETGVATGLLTQDFDATMVHDLVAASKRLSIQTEESQWKDINILFEKAQASARSHATKPQDAQEQVAYFVLDVIDASLKLVEARDAQTSNFHATYSLGEVRGDKRKKTLPADMGGDPARRVIGTIHTHYLLDPLINTSSTALGYSSKSRIRLLRAGVSDVDIGSAKMNSLVIYAIDSKYLHRAVPRMPDGVSTRNNLPRKGNVLRDALAYFSGERQ
ncbi:MAG: hypothetical protein R3B06_21335 [Kofleriaceae bacterium]